MELKSIIESILFGAPKPMNVAEIKDVLSTAAERTEEPEIKNLKRTKAEAITTALEQLEQEHLAGGRTFRLVCVAGAWQFVSLPEYGPWLRVVSGEKVRPPRLSQPALETLAIIAYRQPLTRAEIEQIRGVSVDGVMQTLMERGLVEQVGRAEVAGRPGTFGTTPQFLEYFGLGSLEDLPDASELRRVEIKKTEALQTVELGLATTPPAELSGDSSAQPATAATEIPATAPSAENAELGMQNDVMPATETPSTPPSPELAPEETEESDESTAKPETPTSPHEHP